MLLNDLDEIKRQFVLVSASGVADERNGIVRNRNVSKQVSKWITMAYPTWLLFLRDGTKIEEFLSNIYVPFDCVLMVAQRAADGSGELVRDVYRIDREDGLRSMDFGWWNASKGFHGPLLGLYQRRHDLQGRNIRVVSIHVSDISRLFLPFPTSFAVSLYPLHRQDPPVSRIFRDQAGQTFGIGGFFGEVIQLLQEGMNCT